MGLCPLGGGLVRLSVAESDGSDRRKKRSASGGRPGGKYQVSRLTQPSISTRISPTQSINLLKVTNIRQSALEAKPLYNGSGPPPTVAGFQV